MCDRTVNSTGDLNPYFCNPLSNLVSATMEAAREEARERFWREMELHYVFFIRDTARWTGRKMRSVAEDLGRGVRRGGQ
ncbi:MAG: hypothetical protein F4Y44_11150 [Chloroflexi bacterium]|nr:hypothetical protein [Chloroflexota bacterium]